MKRLLSILVSAGLMGACLIALPARAQEPAIPEVPPEPNIVDPVGDAHYGANGAPADAGTVSDLLAVWFTHDATNLYVHIQTEGPGPAASSAYMFDVTAVPVDGANCAAFEILTPGPNYIGDPFGRFRDLCTEGAEQVVGEYVIQEAADGTGIMTLTVPRANQPMLADGAAIGGPVARVRHATGPVPSQVPRDPVLGIGGGTFLVGPTPDLTDVGTDYAITAAEVEEPKEEKPKKDKPKKPKKKNKPKKPKTPKPPAEPPVEACPAYEPGEMGAEAETAVVTDAATADAPLEIKVTQEMGQGNDLGVGVYDGTVHAFHNVQVDSAAAEAGLYIRYEFPAYEDHDLYVYNPDGSEAAHVGGFNQAPVIPDNPSGFTTDGKGAGGHSEQGAEQIDGLRSADCTGYTVDFANFLGEGGEYTVKVWLGEIQNDPVPAASDAFRLF